jgi:hypothetical protein
MVVSGPLRKEVERYGLSNLGLCKLSVNTDKPPPQGENGLLVSFVWQQLTRFEHIDDSSILSCAVFKQGSTPLSSFGDYTVRSVPAAVVL